MTKLPIVDGRLSIDEAKTACSAPGPAAALAIALLVSALLPLRAEAQGASDDPSVVLYDTGMASQRPIASQTLAEKTGWKAIPEDKLDHQFAGDAVMMNDRLAVAFCAKGDAVDVYAHTALSWVVRASFASSSARAAAQATPPQPRPSRLRVVENNPGAVEVEAGWTGRPGSAFCRLTTGQPYLEVRGGKDNQVLAITVNIQWLVVPDFFGDDLALSETDLAALRTPIPAERMLVLLGGSGESIVQALWPSPSQQVRCWVAPDLSPGIRIDCAKDQRVYLAMFEGAGLWRQQGGPGGAAAGDWKPPFSAKWRSSVVGPEALCESSWLGRTPAALPCDPRRPCLVYPLDREASTPLTTFTPIDIMRATLGFGPCKSLLDMEGFGAAEEATPDQVMNYLEAQAKLKKPNVPEVRTRLAAMTRQVQDAQDRIDVYAQFARDARALPAGSLPDKVLPLLDYMDRSLKACPASLCEQCEDLARVLGETIGSADPQARLAEPVRAVRRIGLAQNRCLAQCRMTVRRLRLLCDLELGHPEVVGKTEAAKKLLTLIEKVQAPAAATSQTGIAPAKE